MFRQIEEYIKHSALNSGQALQGMRYLFTHPDIDSLAQRGTMRHAVLSSKLRARRILNDMWFALIPPHWHHTKEELADMRRTPLKRWFQYGYCAWRFTDDGNPRDDLIGVDRLWDPRCKTE